MKITNCLSLLLFVLTLKISYGMEQKKEPNQITQKFDAAFPLKTVGVMVPYIQDKESNKIKYYKTKLYADADKDLSDEKIKKSKDKYTSLFSLCLDVSLEPLLLDTCGYQFADLTRQILNFFNNRTNLIYDSIAFPGDFSQPLTNIISLIPPVTLNTTIKNLISEKYDSAGLVDSYYADFFKIFLKAIIKKASKEVKNQIPALIEYIVSKEQIEEDKNRGISKLKYLAKALLESHVDMFDTEDPVAYGYIYSYALLAIKKIQQLESPENFLQELDHLANIYANGPSYSETKKNNLKNMFKDIFIIPKKIENQLTSNNENREKEEKATPLNYKKYLITFFMFAGYLSIFTTILYRKQWLPVSLQELISKQMQRMGSK